MKRGQTGPSYIYHPLTSSCLPSCGFADPFCTPQGVPLDHPRGGSTCTVVCGNKTGTLHLPRDASQPLWVVCGCGECVAPRRPAPEAMTLTQFEVHGGMEAKKSCKTSIRMKMTGAYTNVGGRRLAVWLGGVKCASQVLKSATTEGYFP